MGTEGAVQLNTEALVFLKRWKDSRQHEKAFETLSEQCAEILGIAQGLNQSDYRKIIDLDYFELIDRRILSELVSAVKNRTITAGECTQYIRERRNGHWFSKYRNEYEAVDYAAQFLMAVENAIVEVESLAQGVEAYVNTLYRVDQLYRKFLYFVQQSRQATLLNPLADEIRGHYTNSYLRPLSDHWQGQVDKLSKWEIPGEVSQDKFYQRWIWPYTDKKRKIFVIISDAMRYEVGEELSRQIRSEDRYDSELKHVIAKLPCYTQLGMASLLPNKAIQINEDKSASVAVDGQSTQGLTNRGTILDSAISAKALAIQAEEFLTKNQDECRQLTKDHDVIYIYQNRIDKVGHSRDSEKNAFKAVEEAIDELVKLVKKLFGANASNVLVTADHGFVYQDEVVEESDFSIAEPTGDIYYTDRRFMLGHNISEVEGVKKFTAEQLGLQGDLEVVIPKSINRFRKKGSATRFMHGGCTLQEIVLPVVEVNKSRTSDVSMVGVDLLPVSSSVISSGQLSVAFYQTEPVTEKVQARTLKVGLYAPDGQLISDAHELIFDLTSENPREREIKQRFVLSKEADQYNNQQVMLRLQEPISGTSHFQEYKAISYKLQRSFLGDFDF
jgi:uncharacterized protein (TIGR02687 family)